MATWLDGEAESVLKGLLERKPDHADGLYAYAATAAARGDVDETVERLTRALAAGPSYPDGYRRDPRFDRVRHDPRFVALVHDALFPAALGEARP
jgi:hypothetical protein